MLSVIEHKVCLDFEKHFKLLYKSFVVNQAWLGYKLNY